MNHLVLILDLPWELREVVDRYLKKMMLLQKMERILKFPKMADFHIVRWIDEPPSVIRYDYKFACTSHSWIISIRADYRYATIQHFLFLRL